MGRTLITRKIGRDRGAMTGWLIGIATRNFNIGGQHDNLPSFCRRDYVVSSVGMYG
jgi:hypothetical protein